MSNPSKHISHIDPPLRERFWDGITSQNFKTVDGFKANIKPSVGGNSISWINKDILIALERSFQDGTREIREVATGILSSIKTSRNGELAELELESPAKPMQKVSAERVKHGAQWYQNYPLSIVLNELLEKVYKTPTGELPEDKLVSGENLIINAAEGKLGLWNLGIAPSWDGINFEPSINATPITAMATGLDDTELYVALGGIEGSHPPELWLYNPDQDVWSFLGRTQDNKPIQEIFFNKYDNLIYGIIWEDVAQSKEDVENPINKINWWAPNAKIFKWNPFGELESAFIDDTDHSVSIGNIFPGQWDIREMYSMTEETTAGRKPLVGGGYGQQMTVPETDKQDTVPAHKTDFRASAGNHTAFKYVSVPFGPIGNQVGVSIDQERRRGVSRHHPRPRIHGWDNDPIMATWGNTDHNTGPGELIPNTQNGETNWAGHTVDNPPSGWSKSGNATFSVSNGILTINHGNTEHSGINLVINPIEKSVVYRLRFKIIGNAKIYVTNQYLGGNQMPPDSTPFGPRGGTDPEPYSLTREGNGDYYFHVEPEINEIRVYIRPVNWGSGAPPIVIDNLSLTVARYWDQWHSLDTQSGENIPMVNYGKVVVGCYMRTPTHPFNEGPGYSIFDPVSNEPVLEMSPIQAGKYIDEVFLEACLIGQDRRLLNNKTFPAWPPMVGPSEAEDGIPPDNYRRVRVFQDTYSPGATMGTAYNKAHVFDLAPAVDQFSLNNAVPTYIRDRDGNADQSTFERSRAGHGFLSINLHTIGPRADNISDDFMKSGMVRYTNGQQGLFAFSQEADDGKGAIVLCRPNVTTPSDSSRFLWGPNSGKGNNRFKVKYSVFSCDNFSIQDFTGVPIEKSLGVREPLLINSDNWSPIYPTAGVADDQGNVYIGLIESKSVTPLYDGNNLENIINESFLVKVSLGTGALNAGAISSQTIYSSFSDNSVYPLDTQNSKVYGEISDEYYNQSAINKTRKFCWLHFNPDFTNKIMGWGFKRDSILTDPTASPGIPCHELFMISPTNNRLIIVDHDTLDAVNPDATAFLGFVNTNGKFANNTYPDLEGKDITWYFRYKKPTINPQTYYKVGFGVQLCYMYEEDGNIIAGNFWDSDAKNQSRITLKREEGFLANRKAIRLVLNKDGSREREAIFSSFDNILSSYHLSRDRRENVGISSKLFFKLDDFDTDPRVRLYDFTDLQVWDAFSKLATANDFVFGFDAAKFFLLPKNRVATTHVIEAIKGDLIDIEKVVDNDIRNVVSLQPFRPQMPDVEWEVTHVGSEEYLQDRPLFNGEFLLNAITPKKASINLICTRSGRLVAKDLPYGPNEELILQDANDDIWDRDPVLFKWLTHSPTKEVTLMKDAMESAMELYVNTVYFDSSTRITPGELVIVVHPETYEQIGLMITEVDPVLNKLVIERAPGFLVEKLTTLTIVSSNIGTENSGSPDYTTTVRDWSNIMSDEGVCIITQDPLFENGKTVLVVNNIIPFKGIRYKEYKEGNKYYPFLITIYSSSAVATMKLPSGTEKSSEPIAWLEDIDEDQFKLILNKDYTGAFTRGDILNAHYVMPPSSDHREPSPQKSINAPLPNGLGIWNWLADPDNDQINLRTVINLKFPGLQLIKDDGSVFTVADLKSVTKFGESSHQVPDNRFISYDLIERKAAQVLSEFSLPSYQIMLTLPFDPSFTFTTPNSVFLRMIEVIDPIMFYGFKAFKTSGRINRVSTNVNTLITQINYKTREKL